MLTLSRQEKLLIWDSIVDFFFALLISIYGLNMEFDVALILINNEAAHALDCSSTFIPSTKLNKAINHDFAHTAMVCSQVWSNWDESQ